MNKKLKNAIMINISNTLFSTAVKCTILVVFVASLAINFWPAIWGMIQKESKDVYINSDVVLSYIEDENIHFMENGYGEEKADILINYQDGKYKIIIKTSQGERYSDVIMNTVLMHNLSQYIEANETTLTEHDIEILLNRNIELESEVDDTTLENSMHLFILATGVLIFFLMSLLLVRIGAEVGNEKGSKVTEIILTSISKKQFYISHILGSMTVIFISFIIIFIPIVIAVVNDDASLTQDYSLIGTATMVKIFIHCVITGAGLMTLAVSVCSYVKQTEDIGPLNLMIMAPMFLSYIYFGFTVSPYHGPLGWVTYVPIFSFYQNFCGIIKNEFSNTDFIVIEGIAILFAGMIYKLGYYAFSKNIAVDE